MKRIVDHRSRWIRVRMGIMALCLLAFAGVLLHRAFELQVERAPELREMAEEQYLRDIRLAPKRGTIYDRHGAELAVSVDVDSIWANPRALRRGGHDPVAIAERLASIVDIDVEEVARRLATDRYFVWIKRRVSPQAANSVQALAIDGISLSKEARRFYPNRELAAHVLGFADVDGVGLEGLEARFEERLRGSVQAVPAIRDRRGNVVFSEQLLDDRAAQGDDLTLTIDKTIQHLAERELAMAIQTSEAKAGSIVVMDPATGEILAMASYPTFNPNDPGRAHPSSRRNRAITDRYEPGSTVKPFTIAGALAAGTIDSQATIECENGRMQVAEYTIRDTHPFDELTPAQILAYSSNIGTAKIGRTLGREGLFRTMRRFGFGETTGVLLPGEASGILRHYRRWYEMDAATIAFGQGMSVTTLQLATAMSAIANGGNLMTPVLVRRIHDSSGAVLEEAVPHLRRRAIPPDTARLVADMLTAVTGPGGTGPEAAIDGYLVAGKTGTAQKADYITGGYAPDRWLASFVGFVPARDPKLVIAVAIDEPVIAHYGGLVAGPVFRRVGLSALRHLGVPPTHAVANADLEPGPRERGPDQGAQRGNSSPEPPTIAVAPARAPEAGETTVPRVVGRTARAALVALDEQRLRGNLRGSGVVVGQTPAAGEVVSVGAIVEVELEPPVFHHPSPGIRDVERDGEAVVAAANLEPGGT
jgi:cell division protein FtsI (penicillin-binding protein 3)